MSLSEMLPNSFLLPLAISLAVVSIAGYFFLQRMNEQNHKISSMIGLVTTMAEDLNGMRTYIHTSGMTGGVGVSTKNPIAMQASGTSQDHNSLIDVSDDDDDDEDDSDEEDSDEDDSDEDDSDEDDGEEDSDDEVDVVEDVNCTSHVNIIDLNDGGNVKVINMDNNTIPVKINGEFSADDLNSSCDNDDSDDNDSDEEDDDEEDDGDCIVTTELSKDITLKPIQSNDLLMSVEPIVDLEHSNNVIDVIDYKKIAIGKLRGIVEEKGIVADASKMKKVEILKALGHE